MTLDSNDVAEFQEMLWQKSRELYREMPWRVDTKPYYVLVSEIMLQQTQVARVLAKFQEFIEHFPTITSLAESPLADVLTVWSGLGYNRRAKFLHDAARRVVEEYNGKLPSTYEELVTLPGIGPNTAGAILAYSYNQPVVFVETNIRTVLFHHFFTGKSDISDIEIKKILAQVTDQEHPREFYWAMMDYGSWLKSQGAGKIDQSKHYKRQAPLKGSLREVRGLIVKELSQGDKTGSELRELVPDDGRFAKALGGLRRDGLVSATGDRFHLTR